MTGWPTFATAIVCNGLENFFVGRFSVHADIDALQSHAA